MKPKASPDGPSVAPEAIAVNIRGIVRSKVHKALAAIHHGSTGMQPVWEDSNGRQWTARDLLEDIRLLDAFVVALFAPGS